MIVFNEDIHDEFEKLQRKKREKKKRHTQDAPTITIEAVNEESV